MLVLLSSLLLAMPGMLARPGPAERGREFSVGAEIGAPFQVAANMGLLLGTQQRDDQSPNFSQLTGAQLFGRIGASGGSIAVGPASSLESGLFGWALLAGVARTWAGPLGEPWLAPASRTFYGIEARGSLLLLGQLFAGLWYAPAGRGELATWRASFGLGVRLPLFSTIR